MDAATNVELSAQDFVTSYSFLSSHLGQEHININFFGDPAAFARRESLRRSELTVNCTVLAILVCVFGTVFMMLGLYGPNSVCLGPNASILVEPSSILVESIMVKELDYSKPGLQLFGFSRSPPLDVFANWSESRVLSVSQNSYKGWPYYLNKGTTLNISYNVKPKGSAVQLVVNEGIQGISQWSLNEPTYRFSAWSWNLIQGSGMIELHISKSSSYYVYVANVKSKNIKVELDINVKALLYDTKQSFYNCTFSNGECIFDAMSLLGNSVVVTSPPPSQAVSIEDEWCIMFTYIPRYIGYVIGIVMVICFTLVAMHYWKKSQCTVGVRHAPGHAHAPLHFSATTGLLQNKDEDGSSMGSCDESFADDDADLEDFMGNDGAARKRTRGRCAICCDAPRDCFFLPCGHCVSCYQCGTKLEEAGGSCPICRRAMKVKRIFIA